MPTQLNKQAIVNLLIDSPLREAIKINLIDIVNNTTEPDLPKVFPTITKELEIFQKATERRMKLAEETITKLKGESLANESMSDLSSPTPSPAPIMSQPSFEPATPTAMTQAPLTPSLSVPALDLPPMPTMTPSSTDTALLPPTSDNDIHMSNDVSLPPSVEQTPSQIATALPPLPTLGGETTSSPQADEDALAEIQKELDSLKTATAQDISSAATPMQQ